MSINYKEISRRIEQQMPEYSTGAKIVANLVDSLEEEGLLPRRIINTEGQTRRRGRRPMPLEPNGGIQQTYLGTTIKEWRNHRQMSMTDVAILAGLGQNGRAHISSIERGKILRPTDSTLSNIAAALDIPTDYLFQNIRPQRENQNNRQ